MLIQGVLTGLVLAAVALPAAQPVRLGVLFGAPAEASPEVVAEFQRETGRLIGLPGIDVLWRKLEENDGSQVFDRLVVVRFHGSCRMGDGDEPVHRGPLGFTHISDGRILPFIDIDCERLRGTLAAAPGARGYPINNRLLGRALTRVAAHEIYHVLAASEEHAPTGIAKASLSAGELLAGGSAFAEESLERIRAGVFPADTLSASAF